VDSPHKHSIAYAILWQVFTVIEKKRGNMPWEQSKAAKRRYYDGAFHHRYFVGNGIDIGGKPDPLGQYVGIFPLLRSARTWDLDDGDAQLMPGISDNQFDFLHSSHCLEHMRDVPTALSHWIRIVKPGGYLIITVPDEDLYEQGFWPSRYNGDHKWTFTIYKQQSWSPKSLNVLDLAIQFADRVNLERLGLQRDFFRESLAQQKFDQTRTPVTECAIEFILQKHKG
jgi:predicted SAM-dependent methyltransferase